MGKDLRPVVVSPVLEDHWVVVSRFKYQFGTCASWNVFFTFLGESRDGFANLDTYTTAHESSLLWEVENLSGDFYVRIGSSVLVEKRLKLLTSQNLPHENMPETDEI